MIIQANYGTKYSTEFGVWYSAAGVYILQAPKRKADIYRYTIVCSGTTSYIRMKTRVVGVRLIRNSIKGSRRSTTHE
jgi:hypothetical protein